jgi:hypothetical protein
MCFRIDLNKKECYGTLTLKQAVSRFIDYRKELLDGMDDPGNKLGQQ